MLQSTPRTRAAARVPIHPVRGCQTRRAAARSKQLVAVAAANDVEVSVKDPEYNPSVEELLLEEELELLEEEGLLSEEFELCGCEQWRCKGEYDVDADQHMESCMPELLKTGAHVLSKEEWKTRAGGLIKTEDDDVDLNKFATWFEGLQAHSQPRRLNRKGIKLGQMTEQHKANRKKAWDPKTKRGQTTRANHKKGLEKAWDPKTKRGQTTRANRKKAWDPKTKRGQTTRASHKRGNKKRWDPNDKKCANGCRVDACNRTATTAMGRRHHACAKCMQAAKVRVNGAASRWCRWHNAFVLLEAFSGEQRTCNSCLAIESTHRAKKRMEQQQQQQQQQQAAPRQRRQQQQGDEHADCVEKEQQQQQQQQRPRNSRRKATQGERRGEEQVAHAQQQQQLLPCRVGSKRKAAQVCAVFLQGVAGDS